MNVIAWDKNRQAIHSRIRYQDEDNFFIVLGEISGIIWQYIGSVAKLTLYMNS